ncbi:hypothetical protein [Amycolatopsis thailandensis]|uniref:hypothetical protein n=1 Tax=Amycolatopsis thailandensis TaxID=589330 RepID=UPI003629E37C
MEDENGIGIKWHRPDFERPVRHVSTPKPQAGLDDLDDGARFVFVDRMPRLDQAFTRAAMTADSRHCGFGLGIDPGPEGKLFDESPKPV